MARTSKWMLFGIALAGAVAVRTVACAGGDRPKLEPDQRLAVHAQHLCAIAKAGIAQPRTGVVRMLRYHGDHAPDMAAALAETLVLIERIPDDRAHDARARPTSRRPRFAPARGPARGHHRWPGRARATRGRRRRTRSGGAPGRAPSARRWP